VFDIDITDLIKTNQRKVYSGASYARNGKHILRFHNNIKLVRSSIFFGFETVNNKKTDVEYFAVPIEATGFEVSAKGSPPRPKLSIAIDPDGLDQETANRIIYLKQALRDLNDLVGAKVTRTRTFARYINESNFYLRDNNGNITSELISNLVTPPEGYDPDEYAYFTPDIFYIDRKSSEGKNHIELELSSPFDVQDLKLPGRVVFDSNCSWTYRGEGCCYEWTSQKNAADSVYQKPDGVNHENSNGDCKAVGGSYGHAPPVATKDNEYIQDIVGSVNYSPSTPPPEWTSTEVYGAGDITRIKLKGVNYYYVSKGPDSEGQSNVGFPPPNDKYWVADQCSKTILGCKMRWSPAEGQNSAGNPHVNPSDIGGPLPFGGFPTAKKVIR
jgi:lambda family phage minor tail protein L